MNYLLDTNVCIALLEGKPASVRTRLESAIAAGHKIHYSSIVAFELWYGVAKSSRRDANRKGLEEFLDGLIAPLAFDPDDAQFAGALRATLEAAGKPIGAYDLLIAGQALCRKFILVTANVTEFARVKGLDWQDWSKQP